MKNTPAKLSFDELAQLYCERQESTPEQLKKVLELQVEQYFPEGWMLLECHMLDSRWMGSRVVLPYGPNNTYKEVPDRPISPRGLASDMSVVIGVLWASELK